MSLPPGPTLPAPLQTLMFLMAPERASQAAAKQFGDLYTVRNSVIGTEVMVADPELIKQIFTGDPDVFHAGEANSALGGLVGDRSVLLLDGVEHLRQRRLMMPSFHGERMQAYAEAMREITERTVDRWKAGDKLSLHPHMQHITLTIILRTVFGLEEGPRCDQIRDTLTDLFESIQSPFGMLMMHPALQRDLGPLTPWAAFKRRVAVADALIYEEIGKRREAPDAASRTDVLSMFLGARDEEGNPMTDKELRDELMTLLAAGHETTANALCWAFEQILSHPDVRARLDRELADPTSKLEYLDATIKEVLRLRPIVPVVGRRLKAPITLRGYTLPEGTMVVPSIYHVQRRADVYPEPLRFLPERWLGKKPDPYAWIPFGGGVRRCIGMAFALYEMKIVLATILKRARLELERPAPLKIVLRSFVFAPEGGTRVRVASLDGRTARGRVESSRWGRERPQAPFAGANRS